MPEPKEQQSDPFLAEVRRLGGLEFTPQTAEAWAEIAKVLKRRTQGIEHARRVVDRFLEPGAERRCPTPGDIAAMAARVPADAQLDRPELADPCEECQPYGGNWRMVGSGLRRCLCARGEKLRAMDAARRDPDSARRGPIAGRSTARGPLASASGTLREIAVLPPRELERRIDSAERARRAAGDVE